MSDHSSDSMREKADAAFRQASAKVIERARIRGTRIIVWQNGRRSNGHGKKRRESWRSIRRRTRHRFSNAARDERLDRLDRRSESQTRPGRDQGRRGRCSHRSRLISSSSTTPEAASQSGVEQRGDERRHRKLRRHGWCREAGDGAEMPRSAAARHLRSAWCNAPCFPAGHRSRPGSRAASRPPRGLRASPTRGDCSTGRRSTPQTAKAAVAVKHVAHRGCEQPQAPAPGARSADADSALGSDATTRRSQGFSASAGKRRPAQPPRGSRESRSAACRRTRRW